MSDRALAIVLAVGCLTLFVSLVVLVWTRWGQARPLTKCAGLSLAAHALLLIYACSTRVLFDQPGTWLGQTVKIHLVDAQDYEEAATAGELETEQAWDRPGEEAAELSAAPAAVAAADRAATDPTESQQSIVPPACCPIRP
jgi:hypothetical protein